MINNKNFYTILLTLQISNILISAETAKSGKTTKKFTVGSCRSNAAMIAADPMQQRDPNAIAHHNNNQSPYLFSLELKNDDPSSNQENPNMHAQQGKKLPKNPSYMFQIE